MLEDILNIFTTAIRNEEGYLFLFPAYAIILGIERLAHHLLAPKHRWHNKDAAANIVITLAAQGVNLGMGHILPLAFMALIYEKANLIALPNSAWGWLLGFVLYDLAWYLDHRLGHRTGLFWAMHHVHHSSCEYNTTVASRGFIFDSTYLPRPTFLLLPLVGISPFHFVVISITTNIWGIAQHTRLVGKLGWLDWLLATPSSHRVHHGYNEKYIDRNYGEILMIWDHLLGTYQAEEEEPDFGVTVPIETHNPLLIQFAGLHWLRAKIGQARSIGDKLRCLFMPPEWVPKSQPGES